MTPDRDSNGALSEEVQQLFGSRLQADLSQVFHCLCPKSKHHKWQLCSFEPCCKGSKIKTRIEEVCRRHTDQSTALTQLIRVKIEAERDLFVSNVNPGGVLKRKIPCVHSRLGESARR